MKFLKNKTKNVVKLGSKDSKLLIINPDHEITVNDSLYKLFQEELGQIKHKVSVKTKKGQNTKKVKKAKKYDLNNDGKFDEEDKSLAGEVLQADYQS